MESFHFNTPEDAEVKQDEIQEYIQMLESKNCGESEYSGGDEEVQNKDNNVVMNEPEEDIILWNEAIDAMDTIRKYIKQEDLGDETETKLDKLIFDIQKKKVGQRIKQSTCQDSIMKYLTKE